jgi:hypothetical protein
MTIMGRTDTHFLHRGTERGCRRCTASRPNLTSVSHPVRVGHRIHHAIEGYAAGIVRLIGQSYGEDTVQRAWPEFNGGRGPPFCGYEANAELFFSWLFHRWTPMKTKGDAVEDETLYGVPPTRAYLDRGSHELNPLLRRYLNACLKTSPSFYEVLDCNRGLGFLARDVFVGSTYTVTEGLASTTLGRGEIVYAHLIPIEGGTLMDAVAPRSFPAQSKQWLLQSRRTRRALESTVETLLRLYFKLCLVLPQSMPS